MREQKPNFFLIYLAVFVSVVAFSMVFPLLPLYGKYFHASNITIGLLAGSFAFAQLAFSPFWGILSDRYGRKPIILLGLVGLTISFLVFAFAGNLVALFLSRFIQGAFSGATMPAARAYIADVTTKEQRVAAMGKIGASLALGIILGPAIGGLLAQYTMALPFFASAVIGALNLVFVFLFLPESLRENRNYQITIRLAWSALPRIWQGLKSSLMPLFLLGFVWSFALSNNQVNVPLLGAEKFSMSTEAIGLGFGLMGLISAITQFFLLSRITRIFGQHRTVVFGLILLGISFGIMPFLPGNVSLFYLAMAAAGLGSAVARPVITALVTQETTEPQGVTLGTENAFESLGRLLGPLLGGVFFIFGQAVPFLFSAVATVLVVFFVVRNTHFLKQGHAY
ncbi:MAG: MFS transporter [Candidatus Wildermuthbacteria bacterium]|nr:MFS transporter [Candidatus Wildermuthbacteria bacterium]